MFEGNGSASMQPSSPEQLSIRHAKLLGRYVQTCARIEYQIASVICAIEDVSSGTSDWDKRHNKLRANKSTSELIGLLGRSARSLKDENAWKTYLCEITGWMQRFVSNRHYAVHGVIETTANGVRVNSAQKQSDIAAQIDVSEADLNEMLADALKILSNLNKCASQLSKP